MPNIVYVGTSLDGYIADRDGGLDFLNTVPNPDGHDYGFADFIASIDAIVMGRKTLDMVLSFDCEWPYPKPVYVLSSTMTTVPEPVVGKVEILNSSLEDVVKILNEKGFETLYIDGGKLIQGFMEKDMIDQMIITQVPIVLGEGTPLFGSLPSHQEFEHVKTEVLLDALVKSHYKRKR